MDLLKHTRQGQEFADSTLSFSLLQTMQKEITPTSFLDSVVRVKAVYT